MVLSWHTPHFFSHSAKSHVSGSIKLKLLFYNDPDPTASPPVPAHTSSNNRSQRPTNPQLSLGIYVKIGVTLLLTHWLAQLVPGAQGQPMTSSLASSQPNGLNRQVSHWYYKSLLHDNTDYHIWRWLDCSWKGRGRRGCASNWMGTKSGMVVVLFWSCDLPHPLGC